MTDFLAAVGLVLVIEGLCSAAFPNLTRAAMLAASQSPVQRMRIVGIVAAVLGVGLVWLVRG